MTNSRAIDLMYDAIVDDGAFADVPIVVAEALKADSAWILTDTGITGTRVRIGAHHGFDADVVATYGGIAHDQDPWMVAAPRIPHGRAQSMSRFVTDDEFASSEINQRLRGRMDVRHCMVVAIPVEQHISAIAMQRGCGASSFAQEDEASLDLLVPHMVRMMRARHLRERNSIIGRTVFDVQLCGEDAVVICRRDGTIVHANVPAEDMMADCAAPVFRDRARLSSRCPQIDVARSVADAVRRSIPTVHNVVARRGRHALRVDPAPDGSDLAVVTIRDLDAHARRKVSSAAERWGFTAAETRLAMFLVCGGTADQYADKAGLRMPTVRTQLRALLAKVEVERQPQLVAEILASPTAR